MALLVSSDGPESVEGMKMLCYELMDATGGKVSQSTLAAFAAAANNLVVILTSKIIEEMAYSVAGGPLRECIAALLGRLLDERVPSLPEGTNLLKALNVLMLKILDHSNRTYSFCALLDLLGEVPQEIQQRGPEATVKFTDLVVKCLIKITKTLPATIHGINLDELLLGIHSFFMGLGVDEIRRRGAEDDKPLRMVKTVLHELCKVQGNAILHHMHVIPSNSRPAPIINAYVDLNLQTLRQAGLLTGPKEPPPQVRVPPRILQPMPSQGPSFSSHATTQPTLPRPPQLTIPEPNGAGSHLQQRGDSPPDLGSVAQSPASATSSADREQGWEKASMLNILKRIGDKETSQQGIDELFRFKQQHPEADLDAYFSRMSSEFRIYLQRGLSKAARRADAQAEAQPAAAPPAAVDPPLTSPARLAGLRERLSRLASGGTPSADAGDTRLIAGEAR
ncbi:hypothetical protein WJX84_004375 [Apatococcus fuscideae]|uniref:Uncharacterized protein n=1 Tax=Apatococcus fuscideae TaxID=2026836 RepID=A0AAW1T0Z2_9CHLO